MINAIPTIQPIYMGYVSSAVLTQNMEMQQQNQMYQQMLFDILFNTAFYNNWDNIPLYDIPSFDFSIQKNTTNPFYIKNPNYTDKNQKFNASLISVGYDYGKGRKLANIAKKNSVGWTGFCATYVKNDIQEANLGKYETGDAFQCVEILDRNPNFKRVEISLDELKKTPGIVLVYKKGAAKYSQDYGHIEITGGDGGAYSDGVTRNIRPGYIAYAPVSKKSYVV